MFFKLVSPLLGRDLLVALITFWYKIMAHSVPDTIEEYFCEVRQEIGCFLETLVTRVLTYSLISLFCKKKANKSAHCLMYYFKVYCLILL